MQSSYIESLLSPNQNVKLAALYEHASTMLDLTPHFKFFTLHGKGHFSNLFAITDLLHEGGLVLKQDEAFLLGCCLCIHDVGMVIPLAKFSQHELFHGSPQPIEPTDLTRQIRHVHHELVDSYIATHFDFLSSLGFDAGECALIRDIARCHRRVDLRSQQGYARTIGALLRIIDELDILSSRAPGSILQAHFEEMDATSCWHWYKHNITQDWRVGHNVEFDSGTTKKVRFKVAVHPQTQSSIPYWLTQIRRPISRVLSDEGAYGIVAENWGVHISVIDSQDLSSAIDRGEIWKLIEEKALSANRKVIISIDDEVRKLHDLFLPLMQDYHIMFAQNAKDGLEKLAARGADLAIVDLQVGSGFQWDAKETKDFKMTGIKICKEIHDRHPNTKIGILTGSRHDLAEVNELDYLLFFLKKPIDPERFEKEVKRALS